MSCKTRLQICKVDRRSQSRCADLTTGAVRTQNEVAKLDKTSNEKLVQKSEKHCKTQLTQNPGCNFMV